MATARWLMRHPEADPSWRDDVAHLLAWVVQTFGGDTANERGTQWGATVLSEQSVDMAKMGSHTARFGATTALWAELTGDATERDRAARSLAWATYACDEDGIVSVGEDRNEGWWFSDGYGDYIRQFLVAMGAEPEWAPSTEGHVLRSSSIVTRVDYTPGRIAWSTFDPDATETLRLPARPDAVTVGDDRLVERVDLDDEGWTAHPLSTGGFVVLVRHHAPADVVVTTGAPSAGAGPAVDSFRSVVGSGCAAGGPGAPAGPAWLVGVVALAGLRRRQRR